MDRTERLDYIRRIQKAARILGTVFDDVVLGGEFGEHKANLLRAISWTERAISSFNQLPDPEEEEATELEPEEVTIDEGGKK